MIPPDNARLYKSRAAYDNMMRAYDSDLARLMLPYEERWIETRHGVTHVLVAGKTDAPPLVLWHGMNANSMMWVDEINFLGSTRRIYAVDTIGSTGKSAPTRLNKKTTGYAEWSNDVMAGLGLTGVDMLGISGGGWQILRLASFAPERVQRGILLSSGGFKGLRPALLLQIIPRMLFYQILGTPEKALHKFVELMSPPDVPIADREYQMFSRFVHFKSEQDVPPLQDDELRAVTAPMYLLMGQHEKAFDAPGVIERARRLLPNLRHAEILPGVGHGMNAHNPDLVRRMVLQFLGDAL
jgi:pimeloyl-ACP methyl ester carboxylesterase